MDQGTPRELRSLFFSLTNHDDAVVLVDRLCALGLEARKRTLPSTGVQGVVGRLESSAWPYEAGSSSDRAALEELVLEVTRGLSAVCDGVATSMVA